MSFLFTPLAALAGTAGLLAAGTCLLSLHNSRQPGSRWLTWLMAAVALWGFGAAMELSVQDVAAKVAWSKFEYLGTLTTPVLFMLLAADYNRLERLFRRRALALLFAPPTVCFLLALTNAWHGLI